MLTFIAGVIITLILFWLSRKNINTRSSEVLFAVHDRYDELSSSLSSSLTKIGDAIQIVTSPSENTKIEEAARVITSEVKKAQEEIRVFTTNPRFRAMYYLRKPRIDRISKVLTPKYSDVLDPEGPKQYEYTRQLFFRIYDVTPEDAISFKEAIEDKWTLAGLRTVPVGLEFTIYGKFDQVEFHAALVFYTTPHHISEFSEAQKDRLGKRIDCIYVYDED